MDEFVKPGTVFFVSWDVQRIGLPALAPKRPWERGEFSQNYTAWRHEINRMRSFLGKERLHTHRDTLVVNDWAFEKQQPEHQLRICLFVTLGFLEEQG